MTDDMTPMMLQYRRIKESHADAVLFFRLGDFYEMFERDAKEVSALLNLTLTARNGVPMCGIPYHAARGYVARLLRAGRKIAICEQITLPEKGKGIADRDVVEIITPGTVVDEEFLEQRANNFLVSIARIQGQLSFSHIDLSTGEFAATAFPWSEREERLRKEMARLAPREALVQESLIEEDATTSEVLSERSGLVVNRYPDWSFDLARSHELLSRQFGTANLKGFGIGERNVAVFSAGLILEYVGEASKSLLPHIRSIRAYSDSEFLGMDESTQRNLELVQNLQDGSRKNTLVEVLDHTKTSMGGRRLASWILHPLTDVDAIRLRLDRVEGIYHDQLLLSALRERLSSVLDLERLAARVGMERAHAKDLLAIRTTLAAGFRVLELLSASRLSLAAQHPSSELEALHALLSRAIDENASILLTEGGLIKDGFSGELDELRALKAGSRQLLDDYLEEERSASGIGSLKVRFNKIIGYYLEVTKSNLGSVPPHFVRRQSLVGGERFTTERLADLESKLNNATERIVELERQLFLEVREEVKARLGLLQDLAQLLSEIDALQAFAQAATVYGYSKPLVERNGRLHIAGGRHPVVEAHLPRGEFVPNGCNLDADGVSFAMITGPNMAGKSTYLRQVALITLMAQIGSFVPAQEAVVGVADKIFCRVGATDNLARGESTFLVEMNETALILRGATRGSLVIMDEVGRGTGTNDGLAIARAVTEHLLESTGSRTLFATHYHELTVLAHPKLKNASMEVAERDGKIVFLKRVAEGPSENSYGIHVAELAGLPESVIARATVLLAELVARERERTSASGRGALAPAAPSVRPEQAELFTTIEVVAEELRSIDLDRLTPLEALNRVARWRALLSGESRRNA